MKKVFDKTLLLYVALGILNYAVCNALMLLVNISFSVPETSSLIFEFTLQTINSFFLNRFVTFRGWKVSRYWPLFSLLSIGLCYLLAKVLLRDAFLLLMQTPPLLSASAWLQNLLRVGMEPSVFREKLVMLLCTLTYSAINYVGQRYFVFRPIKESEDNVS